MNCTLFVRILITLGVLVLMTCSAIYRRFSRIRRIGRCETLFPFIHQMRGGSPEISRRQLCDCRPWDGVSFCTLCRGRTRMEAFTTGAWQTVRVNKVPSHARTYAEVSFAPILAALVQPPSAGITASLFDLVMLLPAPVGESQLSQLSAESSTT